VTRCYDNPDKKEHCAYSGNVKPTSFAGFQPHAKLLVISLPAGLFLFELFGMVPRLLVHLVLDLSDAVAQNTNVLL